MKEIYPVDKAVSERAHINADRYEAMYRASVEDNEGFWAE